MGRVRRERSGTYRPLTGTLVTMGLNPFREHRNTAFDIAMVVGAIALTIGVVLWAMFGG